MQVFIGDLIKLGDVVLNAYASTGDYRHQCYSFIFNCSLSMFFMLND